MKSFTQFLLAEMKTNNEGRGYHGEIKGSVAAADKAFKTAFDIVKSVTKERDDKKVRNFLDSKYGRHFHGNEKDEANLKTQFRKFSIGYRESDYPEWE